MLNSRMPALEMLRERVKLIKTADGGPIYLIGPVRMPMQLGEQTVEFRWYAWLSGEELPRDLEGLLQALPTMNLAEQQQSSVLVYGDFAASEEAVIRMHSICHTGDIFGSRRCDCGAQLKASLAQIVERGSGALFYLANHEGRGIGLFSKAMTYLLQEQGLDTVEANERLGFQDDHRTYDEAISVLKALRRKPVTLLTNNPKKLNALRGSGLDHIGHAALWSDVHAQNCTYLKTKIIKSGHLILEEEHERLFQMENQTLG